MLISLADYVFVLFTSLPPSKEMIKCPLAKAESKSNSWIIKTLIKQEEVYCKIVGIGIITGFRIEQNQMA